MSMPRKQTGTVKIGIRVFVGRNIPFEFKDLEKNTNFLRDGTSVMLFKLEKVHN